MAGTTEGSFTRVFVRSMMLRLGLALAAMALSYGGAAIGDATGAEWGPFAGGVIGLVIGVALLIGVLRRVDPAAGPTSGG